MNLADLMVKGKFYSKFLQLHILNAFLIYLKAGDCWL